MWITNRRYRSRLRQLARFRKLYLEAKFDLMDRDAALACLRTENMALRVSVQPRATEVGLVDPNLWRLVNVAGEPKCPRKG